MKTVFGLQVTSRDDRELRLTADALDMLGLPYRNFGVIPFTDDITGLEEFDGTDRVLPLCGIKILDSYLKGSLPGAWHLYYSRPELFDQGSYPASVAVYMVNREAEFDSFENLQNRKFQHPTFIKPANDRKMFAAQVLEPGQSLGHALNQTTHQPLLANEKCFFSPAQNVGNEYRLFVVENKVVGASQYRNARGLHKREIKGDELITLIDALESTPFRSPEPFVIDFAEVGEDKNLKVMELNCFNCSGMYAVDRAAVFAAVAKYEGM